MRRVFHARIYLALPLVLGTFVAAACAPSVRTEAWIASAAPDPAVATAKVVVSADQVVGYAKWPQFESIAKLSIASDLVVRGRVIAVEPGRSVTRSSGAAGLPFTNARVAIDEVLQGAARVGDTITIEQTGGTYYDSTFAANQRGNMPTLPPAAGPDIQPHPRPTSGSVLVTLEVEDDPLYQVNEQVVVFLGWRPLFGVYQVPAPQGRFRIDAGRVHAMVPRDPAVGRFHGLPVATVVSAIRAELARP